MRPPGNPVSSLTRFVGRLSRLSAAFAVLLALGSVTASPQSKPPAGPPPDAKYVLADGTPVRLRFIHPVDSSQAIAGDTELLDVVEPVLVNNLIAIRQRTKTHALVTLAQAKRTEGRGGNLQISIQTLSLADGELVPVRGDEILKGAEHRTAAKMTGGGYFFNVYGKNARIPLGMEITVYVLGNHELDPSKFKVAP